MVMHMCFWLYCLTTGKNMVGNIDTCKGLTWIILETGQGGDRWQTRTKKKPLSASAKELSVQSKTIPWHLLRGIFPGHVKCRDDVDQKVIHMLFRATPVLSSRSSPHSFHTLFAGSREQGAWRQGRE